MTTAPVTSISDELLAEIEAAVTKREDSHINQTIMNGTILALITRLRAAERDAGRYRWLRDNWFQIYGESLGERGIKISTGDIWNHAGRPDHVDAAIDAAMSREGEK